jgi:hypothetical protein
MISLKAFLPTLSRFVELSPAALYERQRALVRLELLPTPQARGRNSGGAMATPDAVAMMLIAVLATDNLSDMDSRIGTLADQEAIDRRTGKATQCRITKGKTLREALATVLADSTKAGYLNLELARKAKTARLVDTAEAFRPTQFGRQTKIRGVELTAVFSDLLSLSRELEKVNK